MASSTLMMIHMHKLLCTKRNYKNAAAATLMIRTVGVNASVALEARPLGEEHAQLALLDWLPLVRELALLALRLGRACAGMVSRLPCLPIPIAAAAAGAHWLHRQPPRNGHWSEGRSSQPTPSQQRLFQPFCFRTFRQFPLSQNRQSTFESLASFAACRWLGRATGGSAIGAMGSAIVSIGRSS
jgi:hypothetical protein